MMIQVNMSHVTLVNIWQIDQSNLALHITHTLSNHNQLLLFIKEIVAIEIMMQLYRQVQ